MKPIRIVINVVHLDEHDALGETGQLPFDGSKEGSCVERAIEFLKNLGANPDAPLPLPTKPSTHNRATRRKTATARKRKTAARKR